MANEFIMPKLGLTMEEGTIDEWLVPPGTQVSPGEPVLRITTDKTETDVEATAVGILHPTAAVGDTFACGERIAWMLAEGEEAPAGAPTAASAPVAAGVATASAAPTTAPTAAPTRAGGRLFASPNARRVAAERGIDLRAVRGTGPNGRIVAADLDNVSAPPPPPPPPAGAAVATAGGAMAPSGALTTFAGRALADLLGIDPGAVAPDPTTGRVTRDAVAAHVRGLLSTGGSGSAAAPAATASLLPALQPPTDVLALKGMRGTIASRMSQSLDEMAQLSLFMDADMGAVIADRDARKAAGSAPSYTDYVIAATARALRDHQRINAQVTDDGIALLPDVHIGMAVALDEGLIVPVIRDTNARDLSDLAAESSRLAEAARSSALSLPDLEGGTFSVSTLGMFGVDGFTPIINPPNAAILGVGRLREDLALNEDGSVQAVARLTLSLTWDHRVFDGAPAAAFTQRIVELLGDPAALDQI